MHEKIVKWSNMLIESWEGNNEAIDEYGDTFEIIYRKSLSGLNRITYKEDKENNEAIDVLHGKFDNSNYQVELFFVRNRNNIKKLFIYLKEHDENWKRKRNEICSKSKRWERNGYKLT
jgi:hypothetical protein